VKKTLLVLASLLILASITVPTTAWADESGGSCGLVVCPKP
jgi:hypothetical protein